MSVGPTVDQRPTPLAEKNESLVASHASAADAAGVVRVRLPGLIRLPVAEAISDAGVAPAAAARLVLQRHFNRPTGLLPEQRCYVGCWLDGVVESAWMNDCLLAAAPGELGDASVAFHWLPAARQAFNCLTLVLPWPAGVPVETGVSIRQVALGLVE